MLKRVELSDPNSCLNKAADDEPVFVIRAKDLVAMATVVAWMNFQIEAGKNKSDDPKIQEALAWVNQVTEWREKHGLRNGWTIDERAME